MKKKDENIPMEESNGIVRKKWVAREGDEGGRWGGLI